VDKLFLDANVLSTAAHNPGGQAACLFDELGARRWTLVSSRFAIEEARRNIAAKYPQCQDRLLQLAERVIETPQAAGATHQLTGDLKHFGPQMNRP
jgi:uncharacterized protein